MSGHSHYSTIKRAKEANDQQRGKIFSKLAREISIAVREGGGADPGFNYKLRMVLDKARAANMPKDNIERALKKSEGGNLEQITYEGFGPGGVGFVVQAATDNRNRSSQEIKNIFDRAGGSLAGPGAVSFNFENKGLMVIAKEGDPNEQMLRLIDAGVEDIEDTDDGLEVYTQPDKLAQIRTKLEAVGFTVVSAELYLKPKSLMPVSDPAAVKKVLSLVAALDEHDDVQNVFTNLDDKTH